MPEMYLLYIYNILFGYLLNIVEPHPAIDSSDSTNDVALWYDKMGKHIGWINSKKKCWVQDYVCRSI